MPYLAHFCLNRMPFALTPHRDLFFPDSHGRILEALAFATHRGEGILKVTGDVGTGKTLLCRMLLESLRETAVVAYLTAPHAQPQHMAAHLCQAFDLKTPKGHDPLGVLEKFLVKTHGTGRRAVLLVDEAQGLESPGLEALRLLSNLETDDKKLLQIILFGQQELNHLLGTYGLRQLQQRITFSFETKPLDRDRARHYILHRLEKCLESKGGYSILSPEALRTLVTHGRGIPRLLNILSDKAFLSAYGDRAPVVQKKHALVAVQDTQAVHGNFSWFQRLCPWAR